MEREDATPEQLRSATTKDLTEFNKKSFEKDGVIYYASKDKAQSIIEFSRYKQDCRKRALDLASERIKPIEKLLNGQEIKDLKGLIQSGEIVSEEILMALADKYYNWLISIPS